jgi:hypothetical protein
MPTLQELIPDADTLLALASQDLALGDAFPRRDRLLQLQ